MILLAGCGADQLHHGGSKSAGALLELLLLLYATDEQGRPVWREAMRSVRLKTIVCCPSRAL